MHLESLWKLSVDTLKTYEMHIMNFLSYSGWVNNNIGMCTGTVYKMWIECLKEDDAKRDGVLIIETV